MPKRLEFKEQPDFMLFDIGLPDINRYEVARHLRQDSQTKDVKLIALTGYGRTRTVNALTMRA